MFSSYYPAAAPVVAAPAPVVAPAASYYLAPAAVPVQAVAPARQAVAPRPPAVSSQPNVIQRQYQDPQAPDNGSTLIERRYRNGKLIEENRQYFDPGAPIPPPRTGQPQDSAAEQSSLGPPEPVVPRPTSNVPASSTDNGNRLLRSASWSPVLPGRAQRPPGGVLTFTGKPQCRLVGTRGRGDASSVGQCCG